MPAGEAASHGECMIGRDWEAMAAGRTQGPPYNNGTGTLTAPGCSKYTGNTCVSEDGVTGTEDELQNTTLAAALLESELEAFNGT